MTSTQLSQCHAIIHTATAACTAVGDGIAQIPQSAAQITMIIELGMIFDMTITEATAKDIITGVSDTAVGRFLTSQCIVGCVINATTVAIITEYIGWLIAHKFDSEAPQHLNEFFVTTNKKEQNKNGDV